MRLPIGAALVAAALLPLLLGSIAAPLPQSPLPPQQQQQ
jgi:hypothetical protein